MKLAPSGRALAPLLVPIAAALLLGGCGELGLRNDPPPESFALADSMADTVTSEPVRRAATRTPERGAYPSAEDVMYGPRPRRDTAQPARPEPPSGPQPSDPVKADLERLVRAQEQHWANTGEYAQRFQHLGLRYVPHAGVNVVIESASDSGWVGRAVRQGWEGRSCVVWVGRPEARPATSRQSIRPSHSGVPACDTL